MNGHGRNHLSAGWEHPSSSQSWGCRSCLLGRWWPTRRGWGARWRISSWSWWCENFRGVPLIRWMGAVIRSNLYFHAQVNDLIHSFIPQSPKAWSRMFLVECRCRWGMLLRHYMLEMEYENVNAFHPSQIIWSFASIWRYAAFEWDQLRPFCWVRVRCNLNLLESRLSIKKSSKMASSCIHDYWLYISREQRII